jgi:hypothetical protein
VTKQAETYDAMLAWPWTRRAATSARALALHPSALQLRRLMEAPDLLDDIVLAHALGVTHERTMTALLSPSLRHPRRHALLRVHAALVAQLERGCAAPDFGRAVARRVAAEAARAWLDDSARWPQ